MNLRDGELTMVTQNLVIHIWLNDSPIGKRISRSQLQTERGNEEGVSYPIVQDN